MIKRLKVEGYEGFQTVKFARDVGNKMGDPRIPISEILIVRILEHLS